MSLSTHVLDTARGRPAAGVPVTLHRLAGGERTHVAGAVTNADGRLDAPFAVEAGTYELTFSVGEYQDGFYDAIPVRFLVVDGSAHHHVPLLLSPWSYSTYRGS